MSFRSLRVAEFKLTTPRVVGGVGERRGSRRLSPVTTPEVAAFLL
jgi:hypothetical protein